MHNLQYNVSNYAFVIAILLRCISPAYIDQQHRISVNYFNTLFEQRSYVVRQEIKEDEKKEYLDKIVKLLNVEVVDELIAIDKCTRPLNTDKCRNTQTIVYTFKSNTCSKTVWRGCKTKNKFKDEATCIKTCFVKYVDTWKDELRAMSAETITNLNTILEHFDKDYSSVNNEKSCEEALLERDK